MLSRAHIIVSGKVQGVCYRGSTVEKAYEIGVFGWVKNNRDKTVEISVEGDMEKLKQLIEWCKMGPPSARVENISVDWKDYKGEFKLFETRY